MRSGFRLGQVSGIGVHVDWSLAIIFALVTVSLGGVVFPSWHPDWSPWLLGIVSLAAAALFFVSVLIHEFSHALVGRRHGIEVKRITLFVFGGMAHMEREPGTWRGEFWMAAAGPITSLALGASFLLLGGWMAPAQVSTNDPQEALSQLSPMATLFAWLGPVNILLALFNLVPGFPLDGGRVLRAILWARMNDFRRATRTASQIGQGFAFLLITIGFLMMLGIQVPFFGASLIGGLWLAVIGWFLNNSARASYRQLLLEETLEDVPVVTRIMKTDPTVTVRSSVFAALRQPANQKRIPFLPVAPFRSASLCKDRKGL